MVTKVWSLFEVFATSDAIWIGSSLQILCKSAQIPDGKTYLHIFIPPPFLAHNINPTQRKYLYRLTQKCRKNIHNQKNNPTKRTRQNKESPEVSVGGGGAGGNPKKRLAGSPPLTSKTPALPQFLSLWNKFVNIFLLFLSIRSRWSRVKNLNYLFWFCWDENALKMYRNEIL